ncbi:histidine phosphatase family protein [Silvibacterium dinghuense]|uniref:Histidine phosphatase family protein n=2 Tax=Silvibacterium dinghuense TaxID=1560006 RepID=A0A4Q1SL71_9BACT|nr:histidine phosphatase family protein [Silvibacterium dinghuense]GGH00989.1 phosphoglycerate mutase [Silvibacterium dinghuense]
MSTRFTLIAHAATESQRTAAFPWNEPITQRERERLATHGWPAPKASQVWAAPEARTQETARLLRLEPAIAEALRDCDYGEWRGRTMDEVQSAEPEGLMAWLTTPDAAPHGGESIEQLIRRVGAWLDSDLKPQHIVTVTHPACIRAAIVHALRLPALLFWRFDIAPLTLTDLRRSGPTWTVRCAGCTLLRAEPLE